MTITPIEARNTTGTKIAFAPVTSQITVIDYITGDVDNDGEITDWDAIVLERYLAGWDVDVF